MQHAAIGLALALLATLLSAAAALAHQGHVHADGRIEGKPDVERVGKETHRYDSVRRHYVIERRGQPDTFLHVDPKGAAGGGGTALPTQGLDPFCATSGNRIIPVWHHPPGVGTVGAQDLIRSVIRRMNWKIRDQASRSSGGLRPLRMRVACDAAGQILVQEVVAPNSERPEDIRDSVQGLSPPTGSEAVKYLAFVEGSHPTAAGFGYIRADDRKTTDNANRFYTTTGMVWRDYWERHTTIHELVHTLGGAQPAAPLATPGWHCIDGLDLLCYQDAEAGQPPVPYAETACPAALSYGTAVNLPLDCNTDTYFDSLASPGSYLDTHWNLGGVENPFLAGPVQSAVTTAASGIGPRGATLNADVHGNGFPSEVSFESGTTTAYGASASVATGVTGALAARAVVSGLRPNTTYHYRVVTKSGAGIVTGTDQTFRTPRKFSSFNGDRFADLVIADQVTGSYAVALNDGASTLGGAGNSGPWLRGWAMPPGMWAGAGDFDGDSRTDLIVADPATSTYGVSVSTGTSFGGPGTGPWLAGWSATPNWGGVGDFNGDGLDDLVVADPVTDAYAVALSDGSRLNAPGSGVWLGGSGSRPDWAGVGDFNGDGKDDLMIIEAATLTYRVMLSTGSSFGAAGSGVWQTGWGLRDWAGIGDFNGDGKDDFVMSNGTTHVYSVSISTGSALHGPGTQQWLAGWDGDPNVAGVGDFNADGKDDLIVSDDSGGRYGVALSDGARLDGSGFWLTGWNSAPSWGWASR